MRTSTAVLLAVPAALGAMAAISVPVLRRVRPQSVPPALAGGVGRLQGDGWTVSRWHPILCREAAPHVHLTSPGGMEFAFYESGRVEIPRWGGVPAHP